MRIVIIGRFGTEAFGKHIAEAFRGMGHDVVTCDPLTEVRLGWFDMRMQASMIGKVRGMLVKEMLSRDSYAINLSRRLHHVLGNNDCDLILATHDFLSPGALERLRREFSACLALWFPDSFSRFGKSFMLSGLYDAMFFKDPFIVDRLRTELGLQRTYYLPECCHPDLHSLPPNHREPQPIDIGTAGNLHPARARLLKKLVEAGHQVTVWGPPVSGWMQDFSSGIESRPFVADHDKVRAFRSCKIVLNTTHPAEIEGTNVRTFEAAAAGAFQLASYRKSLDDLFDVDHELAVFRSAGELIEKVNYFLPRDGERRQIAERAQQRALQQHTYQNRLKTMLSYLDGKDGHS